MIPNSCGITTTAPRYPVNPHLHRMRVNYNIYGPCQICHLTVCWSEKSEDTSIVNVLMLIDSKAQVL